MDSMKKMFQRGWQYMGKRGVVLVPSAGKDFHYCWVVEVPKNEQGEDNPHIHMLMNWSVEFKDFKAWASRIEGLWSHGYFHLEHINDPEAAGAYMAKAAGYMTKAEGADDQGKVSGNRYAISTAARAPDWVTISVQEMGIMGRLIRETYDHIQHKYSSDYWKRKKLNEKRDQVIKRARAVQAADPDNRYPEKAKALRVKIGESLQKVRAKINAIPIRASKYQLIIKDKYTFFKFLQKAEAVGWGSDAPPSTKWIYIQKRLRQAMNDSELANMVDRAREHVESTLSVYSDYERWAAAP